MSIIGIQQLVFGVEDMQKSQRFLKDFGLRSLEADSFSTQNGGKVLLKPINDTTLPPAFEEGSTIRSMTWAVKDQAALLALSDKARQAKNFQLTDKGFTCQDPNGLTHYFEISYLKSIDIKPIPMNHWGDYQRVDEPSPVYEKANPINIGHVVFFCEDVSAMETFFVETLGFHVSDRYIQDRGVFLRTQAKGGHHNIFILKLPNRKKGLNHVAFTVRDIHEVFGGGLAMEKNQWATFIGPGRHPISSAYFWYIKSPCGGAFEYYSNEDALTPNWQPREMQHSVESFTEWAIEGGIDYETRRQHK